MWGVLRKLIFGHISGLGSWTIRHFLTANRKKTFQRILFIILAVKESFERFSCFEFIFEKSKHQEAGLNIILSFKLEDYVSSNYISFIDCQKSPLQFYSLCRLFSVVHEHRLQEYPKCRAYQTLLKITHRYKTTE